MTMPTALAVRNIDWEHFPRAADIGVRGWGATAANAFGQAACSLTIVTTDAKSSLRQRAERRCKEY